MRTLWNIDFIISAARRGLSTLSGAGADVGGVVFIFCSQVIHKGGFLISAVRSESNFQAKFRQDFSHFFEEFIFTIDHLFH
jgi:hypothetical protein